LAGDVNAAEVGARQDSAGIEINAGSVIDREEGIPSSVTATPGINTQAVAVPTRTAVATRKYAVELIGTFFLAFTVCATAFISGSLAPLAIGATLMVMVYAGGHICGAHYKSRSDAGGAGGRINAGDAVGYWIAQFVGAVLAALVARGVVPRGMSQP
jgi:aquaporin Z